MNIRSFVGTLLKYDFQHNLRKLSTSHLYQLKGPPRSFALFLKDRKDAYPKEAKVIGGSYMSECAKEWQALPEALKQKYVDEALYQKQIYEDKMKSLSDFERDQIKEKNKQKRLVKKRRNENKIKVSFGKPKGPLSGYNFFVKSWYSQNKLNSKESMSDKMIEIFLEWKNLSQHQKQEFVDLSIDDRERYLQEMKRYVQNLRDARKEELIPTRYKKLWIDSDEPSSWKDVPRRPK